MPVRVPGENGHDQHNAQPVRHRAVRAARSGGTAVRGSEPAGSPTERVERMVKSAEIFVFMKGTPAQPACGFSACDRGDAE